MATEVVAVTEVPEPKPAQADETAPPSATAVMAELGLPQWPEEPELKEYEGGCHCQRFRYKFAHPVFEDGAFDVVSCNCSICKSQGRLNVYAPKSMFEFTKGCYEDLTVYDFNNKVIHHAFCPTCGIPFLSEGFGAVGVNVRTIDGVDLEKLKLRYLNGAAR